MKPETTTETSRHRFTAVALIALMTMSVVAIAPTAAEPGSDDTDDTDGGDAPFCAHLRDVMHELESANVVEGPSECEGLTLVQDLSLISLWADAVNTVCDAAASPDAGPVVAARVAACGELGSAESKRVAYATYMVATALQVIADTGEVMPSFSNATMFAMAANGQNNDGLSGVINCLVETCDDAGALADCLLTEGCSGVDPGLDDWLCDEDCKDPDPCKDDEECQDPGPIPRPCDDLSDEDCDVDPCALISTIDVCNGDPGDVIPQLDCPTPEPGGNAGIPSPPETLTYCTVTNWISAVGAWLTSNEDDPFGTGQVTSMSGTAGTTSCDGTIEQNTDPEGSLELLDSVGGVSGLTSASASMVGWFLKVAGWLDMTSSLGTSDNLVKTAYFHWQFGCEGTGRLVASGSGGLMREVSFIQPVGAPDTSCSYDGILRAECTTPPSSVHTSWGGGSSGTEEGTLCDSNGVEYTKWCYQVQEEANACIDGRTAAWNHPQSWWAKNTGDFQYDLDRLSDYGSVCSQILDIDWKFLGLSDP